MRIGSFISVLLFAGCSVFAATGANPATSSDINAAIQAIQQAPDPSAAVAAYANGTAIARNHLQLTEAYVTRMVQLGLPELAYHQAQAITSLESSNGLAWGVVAYVNARRGEMPEAISAIDQAARQAPNDRFVDRTAGEILAWYDFQADKAKLPDDLKQGLEKVRKSLDTSAAFVAAYGTAKNAYQAQRKAEQSSAPSSTEPSGQASTEPNTAVQPQGQDDMIAPLGSEPPSMANAPDYAPDASGYYYTGEPDYLYDTGPGWVEPAPEWWWQPPGYFSGWDYFPLAPVIVFGGDGSFEHHHHHHFHGHDGSFGQNNANFFSHHNNGNHFSHNNHAFWHGGVNGGGNFFGRPARPDSGVIAQTSINAFPMRAPALSQPDWLRGHPGGLTGFQGVPGGPVTPVIPPTGRSMGTWPGFAPNTVPSGVPHANPGSPIFGATPSPAERQNTAVGAPVFSAPRVSPGMAGPSAGGLQPSAPAPSFSAPQFSPGMAGPPAAGAPPIAPAPAAPPAGAVGGPAHGFAAPVGPMGGGGHGGGGHR